MRRLLRLHSVVAPVVVLAAVASPGPGLAQSNGTPHVRTLADGAQPAPASIEEVAWIAGSWAGTGFGGDVLEVWSSPISNTMVGMYRHDGENGVSFYELQLIVEEEGSLVWKVKHFSPEFSGWEEKDDYVTFRLVDLGDGVAYFDGLTARLEGPDEMTLYMRVRSGETVREEKLQYTRTPLTAEAPGEIED